MGGNQGKECSCCTQGTLGVSCHADAVEDGPSKSGSGTLGVVTSYRGLPSLQCPALGRICDGNRADVEAAVRYFRKRAQTAESQVLQVESENRLLRSRLSGIAARTAANDSLEVLLQGPGALADDETSSVAATVRYEELLADQEGVARASGLSEVGTSTSVHGCEARKFIFVVAGVILQLSWCILCSLLVLCWFCYVIHSFSHRTRRAFA